METNKCMQVVAYCTAQYPVCTCTPVPQGCKVVPGSSGQLLTCGNTTDAATVSETRPKCTQEFAYCDPAYTAPCTCAQPPPGCTVVPGSRGQALNCSGHPVPINDAWFLAVAAVFVVAVGCVTLMLVGKPIKAAK